MKLRPDTSVTPEDLERGRSALVQDAAWATLAGALYGGVTVGYSPTDHTGMTMTDLSIIKRGAFQR